MKTNDALLNSLLPEDSPQQDNTDIITGKGFCIKGHLVGFHEIISSRLTFTNQDETITVYHIPTVPTVRGKAVSLIEYAPAVGPYPRESLYSRAKRRGLLDVWQPHLRLELQHGRVITFTGNKANDLFEALGNFKLRRRDNEKKKVK